MIEDGLICKNGAKNCSDILQLPLQGGVSQLSNPNFLAVVYARAVPKPTILAKI